MSEEELMRKYAEAHGCGEIRIPNLTDEQLKRLREEMEREPGHLEVDSDYPQDSEENEYRYISPEWLDEVARGLTKGAVKHPGETWKTIPAHEHAARALRHLNLFLMGDKQDKHLINASMRCMMAFCTEATEISREAWEKLFHETEIRNFSARKEGD